MVILYKKNPKPLTSVRTIRYLPKWKSLHAELYIPCECLQWHIDFFSKGSLFCVRSKTVRPLISMRENNG